MNDEIIILMRLLNSYIFGPDTLFERLQDYRTSLKEIESFQEKILYCVLNHENNLGGTLDCKDTISNSTYYDNHDKLPTEVKSCLGDFQNLKAEILNYAGGILKKCRP